MFRATEEISSSRGSNEPSKVQEKETGRKKAAVFIECHEGKSIGKAELLLLLAVLQGHWGLGDRRTGGDPQSGILGGLLLSGP